MNYKIKVWDIADAKGNVKFILDIRDGIVAKSSHPKNYMQGWGEEQVINWLKRQNWQVLIESFRKY